MNTAPPDGIVTLLVEDHRSVEQRMADFVGTAPDSRAEAFWKLTDELVRHEVAEEVILYPALRSLPGGDRLADQRITEESEAEAQLARMEKLDPTSPEFMAEFTDLRAAVLEHAKAEERQVFPLVNEKVSSVRLVDLGERYQKAKHSAPNHPHPHAPDTPPGNKVVGPLAALIDRIRDAANGL